MEFISAASKTEALSVLGQFGEDVLLMAGGTDVMVQLARRELKPTKVLHIERAAEMKALERGGPFHRIGALVTQKQLADTFSESCPGLSNAAALCGGWQTQSVGTIAGNICNASPAADLVPPLLVNGAEVFLEGEHSRRHLPLSSFILGRRCTARAPTELVVGLEIDPLGPAESDMFEKVGRRGAMEISIASVAVRVRIGADGRTLDDVRIAVGAMAPVPFRVSQAESVLIGHPLSAESIKAAKAALIASVQPITDTRGTAEYRLAVLPRVFERVLRGCTEAAMKRWRLSGEPRTPVSA